MARFSRPIILADTPLERKLPLIMGGVIVVMLAALLGITRATLYRSAEEAARAKLKHTGQLLSTIVDAQVDGQAAVLRRATSNPVYRGALGHGPKPSDTEVNRALSSVFVPADSGLSVVLLDAKRQPVANASLGKAVAPFEGGKVLPDPASELVERRADGFMLGEIYRVGNAAYSWQTMPVLDSGTTIGYIARQRRSTTTQMSAAARDLIGGDATWYARNRTGTIWIALPGPIASPPERRIATDSGFTDYRPDVGALAAFEVPLRYSPVVLVLETPLKTVLAPAQKTWVRVAALTAILALVGILLSWFLGRRIAHLETRVTEERSAVVSLDRLNQELQEATARAQHATQEAERANRAKSDFLAVMSHELRTPLNAIAGYNELIAMGMYGPITSGQRDALARVSRSQSHLLALITDVLNFAKIEAGELQYDLRDVPLDEALSAAELLVAPQIGAKGLTFSYRHCGPDVLVRADKDRLQQVVVNLLGNAVKFTQTGGSIVMETETQAEVILVKVRDTGVGIAPDRVESIFEPFVQGERAHNRPNEGVGLGLAIARDLMRGMGGDITVSSTVGQGSVFTVRLVRARALDGAVAPPLVHQPAAARV